MFNYSYQIPDIRNHGKWVHMFAKFSNYDDIKRYCNNTWMSYRILKDGEVIETVERPIGIKINPDAIIK
jgi:hypothetical protein